MDPKDFVGLAGVPLLMALVALIKTTIPELPARYYPALSVTLGVGWNVGLTYLLGTDHYVGALIGMVAGLAAAGLFDYGKTREQQHLYRIGNKR